MGGLPTLRTVNGFAVDPQDPKVMFVAMRDGMFQSRDAGETWMQVGKELRNPAAVTVNPKKPTEVYLSTTDGQIYLSADGGRKWKKQQ